MPSRTSNDEDTQPLTIPRALWARPVEVPQAWIITAPRLSVLSKLLPLVTLLCGYTAAVAGGQHLAALSGLLLFAAFVCVLRLGYVAARYAQQAIQYRRSQAQR